VTDTSSVQATTERDQGRVSLADRAYYAIREMIVSLELRPGSVVNERDLMERLELGRTPVREAVRRLAQEQLVEVYPRRGTFVTSVEIRDLASICDVRLALEARAARLAAERASDADREEIRRLIAELDGDLKTAPAEPDRRALMAVDERIHRIVYRATHNQFLAATLEEYYLLALRIWFLALEQPRELEQAVLEHRALLEAILARDGAEAERIMRAHVDNFEAAIRLVLLET
jgi:DNA-binding GntR family transcriptional regulator